MDEEGTLTDPDTGQHWTHYDSQLDDLSEMVARARTPAEWGATVYDAWLYALEPVWQPHGAAYPDFMRAEPWEIKDLQTGLGSYTELKHDTILYAKQSVAAEGDYEPVTYPDPRHWVEPNPVAFARMAAMLGLLSDGLSNRGLLPAGSENAELIDALDTFLSRLAGLAADELAGRPISAEDNQWLQIRRLDDGGAVDPDLRQRTAARRVPRRGHQMPRSSPTSCERRTTSSRSGPASSTRCTSWSPTTTDGSRSPRAGSTRTTSSGARRTKAG